MCRWLDRVANFAGATILGAALLGLPAQAGPQTPAQAGTPFAGIGRPATPAEIRAWDIDVRPDFQGLPPGSGSVAKGQRVWDDKCASCHGTFGESNEVFAPIVGGTTAEDVRTGRVKALTRRDVGRTTLMKLPTVSTLWDYINRAMPWTAPKTLSTEEVYAVVAYILHLGDVLPSDFVLSDRNIAEVQARLPNRDGMTRDHGLWDVRARPDVANAPCMKDCAGQVRIASSLPPYARDSHGSLAQQNRIVGPVRGVELAASGGPKLASLGGAASASDAPPAAATAALASPAKLAASQSCLACHAADRKLVGPALRDVAERYQGQPGADVRLAAKIRQGSSGAWGAVPMPPNAGLSEADALALAQWILGGAR